MCASARDPRIPAQQVHAQLGDRLFELSQMRVPNQVKRMTRATANTTSNANLESISTLSLLLPFQHHGTHILRSCGPCRRARVHRVAWAIRSKRGSPGSGAKNVKCHCTQCNDSEFATRGSPDQSYRLSELCSPARRRRETSVDKIERRAIAPAYIHIPSTQDFKNSVLSSPQA